MPRSHRLSRSWRLPFPLVLAFRYARSTRKDAFVSFLSAVAVAGIALGVAALILASSALAGLQEALRSEVLARTPQLEAVLPSDADPLAAERAVAGMEGVESVQRTTAGRGWIRWGRMVQTVEIVGYSGPVPRSFPGATIRGKGGLLLSSGLASRWGIEAGDVVELVAPRPTLTPLGPQPRLRSVEVAGTFVSGRTEEGERVAVALELATAILGGPTRLAIWAADLDRALELAPAVAGALPEGTEVRTWKELNRPLFFALRLEKVVMFVAVSLVVVVAALALVADLALVITSKRAELGMVAAMGATGDELRLAVLALGGVLAGVGLAVGTILGSGLAAILDRTRLVRLPDQVYFLDHLPFRLEALDLVAIVVLTAVLALGSASAVAQRVAGLRPVEAMRR